MSFATEEFKEDIREKQLRPAFLRDVAEFTDTRFHNRKWGERLEVIAKITTALAMGSVGLGLWSPEMSRVCMLASLMLKSSNLTLLAIASVLKKRAAHSTDQLNRTLKTIGIETIVPHVVDHSRDPESIAHPAANAE